MAHVLQSLSEKNICMHAAVMQLHSSKTDESNLIPTNVCLLKPNVQYSGEHLHILNSIMEFKACCGLHLCLEGVCNFYSGKLNNLQDAWLLNYKRFAAFCFRLTTVICLKRFYEVRED